MSRTFTTYSLLLLMALGVIAGSIHAAAAANAAATAEGLRGHRAQDQAVARDARNSNISGTDQHTDKVYRSMTENREALSGLFGERRADAAILAVSPAMQAAMRQTAGKASAMVATPTQTLDSTIALYRAVGSQNWVNDYKTVFTYNAQMLTTEMREYRWSSSQSNWLYGSRMVYGYNNQGLATEMLFYDPPSVLDMKMELFYNPQGLADSVYTYESGNGGELMLYMIQHYRYENGRITEIAMLIYDDEEDEWFGDMVIRFAYDGQGRRTSMGWYVLMDEEDEDPFLYSLTEYTYTTAGRLQSVTHSTLNFFTFQLEPSDKTEYTYNAAGDLTMAVEFWYTDGIWGEEFKDEYAYHASLQFADVANPLQVMSQLYFFIQAFPEFNRMLTEIHGFEFVDGSWVETERTTFHISGESATSTEEVQAAAAPLLYPNPAGDHITLSWTGPQERLTLEVYHITGSLVFRQELQSGQQLSVEHLRTGMYLYRLADGQTVIQAGKLMKR